MKATVLWIRGSQAYSGSHVVNPEIGGSSLTFCQEFVVSHAGFFRTSRERVPRAETRRGSGLDVSGDKEANQNVFCKGANVGVRSRVKQHAFVPVKLDWRCALAITRQCAYGTQL